MMCSHYLLNVGCTDHHPIALTCIHNVFLALVVFFFWLLVVLANIGGAGFPPSDGADKIATKHMGNSITVNMIIRIAYDYLCIMAYMGFDTSQWRILVTRTVNVK